MLQSKQFKWLDDDYFEDESWKQHKCAQKSPLKTLKRKIAKKVEPNQNEIYKSWYGWQITKRRKITSSESE